MSIFCTPGFSHGFIHSSWLNFPRESMWESDLMSLNFLEPFKKQSCKVILYSYLNIWLLFYFGAIIKLPLGIWILQSSSYLKNIS